MTQLRRILAVLPLLFLFALPCEAEGAPKKKHRQGNGQMENDPDPKDGQHQNNPGPNDEDPQITGSGEPTENPVISTDPSRKNKGKGKRESSLGKREGPSGRETTPKQERTGSGKRSVNDGPYHAYREVNKDGEKYWVRISDKKYGEDLIRLWQNVYAGKAPTGNLPQEIQAYVGEQPRFWPVNVNPGLENIARSIPLNPLALTPIRVADAPFNSPPNSTGTMILAPTPIDGQQMVGPKYYWDPTPKKSDPDYAKKMEQLEQKVKDDPAHFFKTKEGQILQDFSGKGGKYFDDPSGARSGGKKEDPLTKQVKDFDPNREGSQFQKALKDLKDLQKRHDQEKGKDGKKKDKKQVTKKPNAQQRLLNNVGNWPASSGKKTFIRGRQQNAGGVRNVRGVTGTTYVPNRTTVESPSVPMPGPVAKFNPPTPPGTGGSTFSPKITFDNSVPRKRFGYDPAMPKSPAVSTTPAKKGVLMKMGIDPKKFKPVQANPDLKDQILNDKK